MPYPLSLSPVLSSWSMWAGIRVRRITMTVFIMGNGQRNSLWRAVDQHGRILDVLVTSRRNAKTAARFFRKLFKGLRYVPKVLVTDKLASYGVADRRLTPGVEHRRSKYLNNRAENSHQPTRQRERAMKGFTSAGHAQRFLSVFSGISPRFRPRRHRLTAGATDTKRPPASPPETRSLACPRLPDLGRETARPALSHATSPATPNNLTTPWWRTPSRFWSVPLA